MNRGPIVRGQEAWISVRMVLIGLVSIAVAAAAVAHPRPRFTCAMAATNNGWCDACGVGYLATVEIGSAKLFEALDADGHDFPEPEASACPVCRDAWATNGYCHDCRIGFVDGHGYFTKVTYLLAKGEVRDPAKLACTVCAKAAADTALPLADEGWCDVCGRGMVGNVAFRDKKDYAAARKQFELLLRAVKESERCEMCSMLLFYGGVCQACDITYKNGKVVERAEK